jgi:hypothetical protein
MAHNPIEIEKILDQIEKANQQELQEIMDSIQERYAQILPQWDILYLALPKEDCDERRNLIRKILDALCI